jgi:TATA-box binding protein (TBP) (component of TFIID and TFIIIB)
MVNLKEITLDQATKMLEKVNGKEYFPTWVFNERNADVIIFLNVDGKLVTGEKGKHLEFNQSQDLNNNELTAVNNYLIVKGR